MGADLEYWLTRGASKDVMMQPGEPAIVTTPVATILSALRTASSKSTYTSAMLASACPLPREIVSRTAYARKAANLRRHA